MQHPVCGLGPHRGGYSLHQPCGSIELLHARPRLAKALTKSRTARGHNSPPIFALSPVWEKEFLAPSMACSTANAFDIVCRLDRRWQT